MGVLRSSSRLILAKMGVVAEWTMGDLNSEGYVADSGVFREARTGLASVAAILLKFCRALNE